MLVILCAEDITYVASNVGWGFFGYSAESIRRNEQKKRILRAATFTLVCLYGKPRAE